MQSIIDATKEVGTNDENIVYKRMKTENEIFWEWIVKVNESGPIQNIQAGIQIGSTIHHSQTFF